MLCVARFVPTAKKINVLYHSSDHANYTLINMCSCMFVILCVSGALNYHYYYWYCYVCIIEFGCWSVINIIVVIIFFYCCYYFLFVLVLLLVLLDLLHLFFITVTIIIIFIISIIIIAITIIPLVI